MKKTPKRPRRRRSWGRIARFGLFLLIVFFASFFLAGGHIPLSPQSEEHIAQIESKLPDDLTDNLTDSLPADAESALKKAPDELRALPLPDRLHRLIYLREAVDARVDRNYYVPLSDIPADVQHAVVAVEDSRFYDHHGIDLQGIGRAVLVDLQNGSFEEGGSTIPQQLAKNLFLTQDQTFGRKLEEALLAVDLEANYSKEEILELYLNTVYYGSGFYGIGPAAHGYFGKSPSALQLPESAMLAGLPNAPSLYSPYVDFMMAKKRQFVVLDAMEANGYIDSRTAENAKIKPIYLAQ